METVDLVEVTHRQDRMRERVERADRLGDVRLLAGADVAYHRSAEVLYAAVVVLEAATLRLVEARTVAAPVTFPYVPGYLTLREAPPVLEAFGRLTRSPDLLLVDGHGWAHPRRFGIACHLGVALDLPAIGVAKSVLVGSHEQPGPARGSVTPLLHEGDPIGATVRTRDGVAPVWVSTGHRVSLPTAVRWVLACGAGYRIPEPTRLAHIEVNRIRAEHGGR